MLGADGFQFHKPLQHLGWIGLRTALKLKGFLGNSRHANADVCTLKRKKPGYRMLPPFFFLFLIITGFGWMLALFFHP